MDPGRHLKWDRLKTVTGCCLFIYECAPSTFIPTPFDSKHGQHNRITHSEALGDRLEDTASSIHSARRAGRHVVQEDPVSEPSLLPLPCGIERERQLPLPLT
jgi:hypothetical protein